MQLKAVLVVITLASTPFLISAVAQDPAAPDPIPLRDKLPATTATFDLNAHRSEIEKLRAALKNAEQSVQDAQRRSDATEGELDEALDIIAKGGLTFGESRQRDSVVTQATEVTE